MDIKVTKVTMRKTIQLKQYEPVQVEMEAEVRDGENPNRVFRELAEQVEMNLNHLRSEM